jgi:hypothetical protein
MTMASSGERKQALPEPAGKQKKKVLREKEKKVRPKPGDVIPFDQEDKESFTDF